MVGMRLIAARPLSALAALALIAGVSIAKADDAFVDTRELPRLEGAVNDPARTTDMSSVYSVPGTMPNTLVATRQLLIANGWKPFSAPEEKRTDSLNMKKGRHGLSVHFAMTNGDPNKSSVYYTANRLYNVLPFPDDATDFVYDMQRPYLSCIAPGAVDAVFAYFDKGLVEAGFQRLSAADIAAKWPNANIDDKSADALRAYYVRDPRRPPIVLAVVGRPDGKTNVEIRVPAFGLPQKLEADNDMAGLPRPKLMKSAQGTGSNDSIKRELKMLTPAEFSTVLAFYRRELEKRSFKEEARGASVGPRHAELTFSSPTEGTAALKLGQQYDLTTVSLVVNVPPAVAAAKIKAQREALEKQAREAEARAKAEAAALEAKYAAMMSTGPVTAPAAAAGKAGSVPLPENATDVEFKADRGNLEFNTPSSAREIAAFYRAALKPQGWTEAPSVINKPNMVVLEFSKGRDRIEMTAMQMGRTVNVSASGSGLKVLAAAAETTVGAATPAKVSAQELEAEMADGLPVPKNRTLTAPGTWKPQGGGTPFRRELDASVPAELAAVLAFYRRELGKLQWKEAQGAVVAADKAHVAFASPDGPAVLKLGRQNGETSINLALKIPAEAKKAGVAPPSGKARLMFGNMGDAEAAVTIGSNTIKVAPGAGGPQSPDGPKLELSPGKYKYAVKVGGKPGKSGEIEVGADDTWGLMIAPGGGDVLSLQMY